jgi:preprotein translocase subunit SecD
MVQFKKWQLYLVILFSVFAIVFSLPNFFSKNVLKKFPSFIPSEQVILGLDLQGGSYLLIEVDTESVVSENLESFSDGIRLSLRKNKIPYSRFNIKNNNIFFNIKNEKKKEELSKILSKYSQDISFEYIDDKLIKIFFNNQKIKNIQDTSVSQSIEVVRRRVDEYGTKEPTIQRQGLNRILLELPGITDPERLKKLLGKTAKLTLQIIDDDISSDELRSGKSKPGINVYESDTEVDLLEKPLLYAVKKKKTISGDLLINAFPTVDNGSPVVSFEFNNKGGRKFGKITTDNIGKRLAIILDKKVISSPNIREPITGGRGIITGQFTFQEATDLSMLLRAGALPAPLNIIEERTVGPSLGADSIKSGKFASILGFFLIIIFMFLIYGIFGIFANIALIFNLLILLAILTLIKSTLTLPGIAGIVLTIGMAVDANVLIFERIKEEIKHNLSPIATIDIGYKEAFKTIVDANITTLIAAIMLFGLGSGPVKGFAVTLSIGILTSMFTAIMFTRILILIWLRKKSPERINL